MFQIDVGEVETCQERRKNKNPLIYERRNQSMTGGLNSAKFQDRAKCWLKNELYEEHHLMQQEVMKLLKREYGMECDRRSIL